MKPKTLSAKYKRFIIYARCSTDDQSRGDFTTLDSQVHHCKNMLKALDYSTSRMVKDDGYSGKDLKRPGIQSILKEIGNRNAKPSFDGIIFLRLDRLTRRNKDLFNLVDVFAENNIQVISVREGFDTSTSHGRAQLGMMGTMAQFEREQIGERVKASALARISSGRWPGRSLPYGYKRIQDGDPSPDGQKRYKIALDEEIAHKIKLVWEFAAENKSIRTIAKELSKKGLKSPSGSEWRVQSILNVLRNPFYYGHMRWNGKLYPGNHEALLDKELWDKANKVVSSNLPGHRFIAKPKNYIYLLEGLLKCGSCGSQIITKYCKGQSGKQFFYYLCTRQSHGLGCDSKQIPAPAFDDALTAYFQKSSKDQRLIITAIEDAVREAQSRLVAADKDIHKTEKKLSASKNEAEKLMDLALKGTISKGSTYRTRLEKIEADIETFEESLSKLRAQKKAAEMSADSASFIHSNIVYIMGRFSEAAPEARKALFQALIKEIVVHDNHIELKMFLGPTVQEKLPSETSSRSTKRPSKKENASTGKGEALTASGVGSPQRQEMLPRQGSNLRPSGYGLTLLA